MTHTLKVDGQFDLLDLIHGETRGQARQDELRFATVLTCIRDAMPDAMRFMIDLWAPADKAWHGSGEWSYWWTASKIVAYPRRRGEVEHSMTWEEFADLVGDHPDRQSILGWEQSLEDPKWKDLYRPDELSPYAGDHGSDFEFDRNRPGWDARLKAWRALQSILTDVIRTIAPDWESFRLPQQEWQRPRGSCRFCREEVVVGGYAEGLNHSPMGNVCTRQWLIRNHAFYAHQQLEEARKNPEGKDVELLEVRYEHDAAKATAAWHGDGWKTFQN